MIQITLGQKLPSLKRLADKFQLDLIILFGSQASGRVHAESDADIAVRGTKALSLSQQLSLARQLDKHFIDTDLVDLKRASPLMLASVATSGKLLFERRKNTFAHFKILAVSQYLDFKTYMKFSKQLKTKSRLKESGPKGRSPR